MEDLKNIANSNELRTTLGAKSSADYEMNSRRKSKISQIFLSAMPTLASFFEAFSSAAKGANRSLGAFGRAAYKRHRVSHHYPESSTRQHERHARSQRMVVVNGFEIMQTLPSRLRTPTK